MVAQWEGDNMSHIARRPILLGIAAVLLATGGSFSAAPSALASASTGYLVVQIAAGNSHSCARIDDGTLKCWGENDQGQIGDGTNVNRPAPAAVPGLAGVTVVAAGGDESCAIVAGGAVDCWGQTTAGASSTPHAIAGLAGATALAVGWNEACVIVSGVVKCWGQNGISGSAVIATPTTVAGTSGATALAAGGRHACAIVGGGAVRCWGDNELGQLGNGTHTSSASAVAVAGVTGATSIAVGFFFSCAIVAAGAVKCWGSNNRGELGNGTTGDSTTPTAVNGLSGAMSVSTGFGHACAAVAGGTVKCWGDNFDAMLGNGRPDDIYGLTPVAVVGLTGATAVASGEFHNCALLGDGTVWCWGGNGYGTLGAGLQPMETKPVAAPALSSSFKLAADLGMAVHKPWCALRSAGTVDCWGQGYFAQPGSDLVRQHDTPTPVAGITDAVDIAVNQTTSCAIVGAGRVNCWGLIPVGADQSWSPVPVEIAGMAGATAISGAGHHLCVVLEGTVVCSGFAGKSDLATIAGVSGAVAVSVGDLEACALLDSGTVMCWLADDTTAQLVPGLSGATQLAAGQERACAIAAGGQLKCWAGIDAAAAVPDLGPVKAVALGESHTCAVLTDGTAECWGQNGSGQLGDGTTTDSLTPVPVFGLSDAVALLAAKNTTCAIIGDGSVLCWGDNGSGDFNNGLVLRGGAPVKVLGLGSPAIVPDAPAVSGVVPYNSSVVVSWTAPADNGSPITGYAVVSSPAAGGCSTIGTTSCTVTGLTNGTSYTFLVSAANELGLTGPAAESGSATPIAVPDRPYNVAATRGDASATVTWTAPGDNGGVITGYTVTSAPQGRTCTSAAESTCEFSGLTNGVTYTFTVVAANASGAGPRSDPSNAVMPGRPDAPRGVTAVGFDGSVSVSWTASVLDGGFAISGYTATATPGVHSCTTTTALTCSIGGLANHTTYSVTVTAANTDGSGPASGPAAQVQARSGSTFFGLTPNRLLNTATGLGLGAHLTAYTPGTFQVTDVTPGDPTRNVPANATSVTGVLTVSGSSAAGFVSLTPEPDGAPSISTINFPRGDSRSTGVTVQLGSGGRLSLTYGAVAGSTVDAIFDVTGYFVLGTGGSEYVPVTPNRIADSRPTGSGHRNTGFGSIAAGTATDFQASLMTPGLAATNVPATAVAVTGTLTVTGQTAAGFLTLGPGPAASPGTASLYFPRGDNRATGLTVKLGIGGRLAVAFTSPTAGARTDVIFDVTGYFVPSITGATFVPLVPNRIADSRPTTSGHTNAGMVGALMPYVARSFQVTGRTPSVAATNVPTGAVAVTGTLTVAGQTAAGFLSLTNLPTNVPNTSTLNFPRGDTRATGVTVTLSPAGKLSITYGAVAGASTYFVFDVTGYFLN
jgi:alpha-tubulin suppressor-like RCC1 family protein